MISSHDVSQTLERLTRAIHIVLAQSIPRVTGANEVPWAVGAIMGAPPIINITLVHICDTNQQGTVYKEIIWVRIHKF